MHTKQRPTQNPNKHCEVHKTIDQQQQIHHLRKDSSQIFLGQVEGDLMHLMTATVTQK